MADAGCALSFAVSATCIELTKQLPRSLDSEARHWVDALMISTVCDVSNYQRGVSHSWLTSIVCDQNYYLRLPWKAVIFKLQMFYLVSHSNVQIRVILKDSSRYDYILRLEVIPLPHLAIGDTMNIATSDYLITLCIFS